MTPEPLIPVYLNQRAVFDLVAMLQGGISTLTRVSETTIESSSTERDVGATFGLANAFASLLKIDLSAARRQAAGEEATRSAEQERIHTPASLFFSLQQILIEKSFLRDASADAPTPGQFIRFSVSLRRNPVIELIDVVHEMMKLGELFSEPEAPAKPAKHGKPTPKKPVNQLQELREMLRSGATLDLTGDSLPSGHRVLVTLEAQYLNDPSMGDLVDGTFTVVGKVTRVLGPGGGAISLMRKTALGRLPPEILAKSFSGFDAMSSEQGFALPKAEWELQAPVVQVLPVAIYT